MWYKLALEANTIGPYSEHNLTSDRGKWMGKSIKNSLVHKQQESHNDLSLYVRIFVCGPTRSALNHQWNGPVVMLE